MKNKLLLIAMGFALTTQMIIAQVPSYVPTNGLVGYWPFNGNANDESGNGNNGAVNGAILANDRNGLLNSSYSFNGTSSTIDFANQLIPSNGSFTISVWTYLNNNNLQEFFHQNVWPGAFYVGINNGILRCGDHWQNTEVSLENNSWIHLVIVRNYQNNVVIYKNGILVATKTSDIYLGGNATDPLILGRQYPTNTEFLNGKLDDLGIWSRALTEQEIANLYNSTSINTAECLTMTINTGVLSTTPVTYTSSVNIYPNPANDHITIDCGNLANVSGWSIKITNMLGQEVFNQPMNTQQYIVPLNSWTGQGMYFVKIINAQNEVVNIKKIILQ
jgi:hypothetical protein